MEAILEIDEYKDHVYVKMKGNIERKFMKADSPFKSQYISWTNAKYMYAEEQKEETDDYLLNHALQEEVKLCASFYTKDAHSIIKHFEQDNRFICKIKELYEEKHKGFSIVYVVRKGCLDDYYDVDRIIDVYREHGFKTGSLETLREKTLMSFVDGDIVWDGVAFDLYVDTERPQECPILKTFGPSTMMIIGLLFGYPIELTVWSLNSMGMSL